VEAASVGTAAVSRNRFKEEEFLSFSIPLPPLPLQEATVAHWRKAQEDAAKSRDTVAALETEIQDGILNALRIKPPIADRPLSKAFALQWIDLERWSVDFLARDALSRSGSVSSFPMTILGALAQISYGIQKCPANRPGKHPRPYLRVANVQRGGLDLREIKYIDVPDSELETFRLSSGDLLVCEGNSADLVGRPALWNDEIPDCVHQNHVLRVRVDHYKALPEYVLEYMSTFCARAYFRSRAKFTTNLASINSNDLRGLPLPLPPLEVQRKIVNMVNEKRTRIAEERKAAEQRKAQATREVEEMILGVRPIG
jgi:type I restriction enzyme S subunit